MFSNDIVIKILEYINKNLNKKITMDELQDICYYNKDYLMRLFKRELNTTIFEYINKRRIYNSLELLKSSDCLMTKIAMTNGFTSQEYFSEMFTKYIGVNPMTYRKFIKGNPSISLEEYNSIITNIPELKTYIASIDKYYSNKKPDEIMTKKLSLFK